MDKAWSGDTLIEERLEQVKRIIFESDTGVPKGIQENRFGRYLNGKEEKMLALYARGVTKQEIKEQMLNLYRNYKTDFEINSITDKVHAYILTWQIKPLGKTFAFCNIRSFQYPILEKGKLIQKEIYIVFGVGMNGERNILDILEKEDDSLEYWMNVLCGLKKRGIEQIMLFYTDKISGIQGAIHRVYEETNHCVLCYDDLLEMNIVS